MKTIERLVSGRMAAIALGLTLTSSAYAANPVVYSYNTESYGGLNISLHTSDFNSSVPVGEFNMTSVTPGYSGTLNTYCTDVDAFLQTTYSYTPTPLSSATGVSPAWITGGIQNAANVWYNNHNSTTTAIQTAGLQLAIWELLYNSYGQMSSATFFSASNKGFYLTSNDANSVAAANYAAAVINGLSGQADNSSKVEWLAPTAADGSIGGSQGLLMTVPSQVPDASSTLGLFGIAAAGLLAARRKLANAAR